MSYLLYQYNCFAILKNLRSSNERVESIESCIEYYFNLHILFFHTVFFFYFTLVFFSTHIITLFKDYTSRLRQFFSKIQLFQREK